MNEGAALQSIFTHINARREVRESRLEQLGCKHRSNLLPDLPNKPKGCVKSNSHRSSAEMSSLQIASLLFSCTLLLYAPVSELPT